MCSVEHLRELIRQRLSAAAEEIFSEVENTIRLLEIRWRSQITQEPKELHQQEVLDEQQLWNRERNHGSDQLEPEPWMGRDEEQLPLKQEETLSVPQILEIFRASEIGPVQFEEETDLQRRLLDVSWKPERKSPRTEPPQQQVFEEEVLTDRQLWNPDRTSSSDQEQPEPPRVKQNQEEPEQPLKQEYQEEPKPPRVKQNQEEPEPPRVKQNQEQPKQPLKQEYQEEAEPPRVKQNQEEPEPPRVKQNQEQPKQPLKQEYQEEAEPPRVKQNQEEPEPPRVKQNQEEGPLMPPDSETSTVLTDEESDQREPEPNPEKVRDPDGFCRAVESEPTQRSEVKSMKRRKYAESSSGSESSDEGAFMVWSKGPSGGPVGPEPSTSSAAAWSQQPQGAERLYSCNTCGKRFRFNCRYLSHMRTHTGEKPFSCRQCGKSFTQGGSLWRHVRTHSGEKPFICRTCGRSFSQKGGLLGHIRTQHGAEKPSSC